ncbi:MAG: response regulator [Hyphomicrobiales bacterium]
MSTGEGQSSATGPVIDRPVKSGNVGLLLLLAGLLGAAGVGFALMEREAAEPLALGLLSLLAVVGVVMLAAMTVGLVRFAGGPLRDDLTRAYVDSMPEGVLVTDSEGRILYANRAYGDMIGADSAKDVRSVERVFSRDPDAADLVYRLLQAAREGRGAEEEMRLAVPLAGAEAGDAEAGGRWYRVQMRPTRLGDDRAQLTAWQVADITRDRQRQENIFLELQNAIDYLDHAPAGFLSADPAGRIVYLNATLADWLGYDLARFERGAIRLSDIVSGDGAALLAGIPGSREARTELIDIDLVKRNGQRFPVRLLHRVPIAGDGRAGASRTLVLNRSPGEDVSEALRAAEVRFARFFNNTPIAIAGVGQAGAIGRTNAPFRRLFGALVDHENATLLDVIIERDRAALAAAITAAAEGQGEVAPVDANLAGTGDRSARFFVSGVEDGDGEGERDGEAAIVYTIETTEQRALEAQFAQSQKMQAIGQLAGGVAHDFNNVLTAIIGFSDLLLANHRPSDPAFQDIMNIKQNANRAAGLVRQLLAFSRRQTLRPQVLSLGDVLSDLTVLLDRLLGEKVGLEVVHGRDVWPVKADVNQLEQVVMNLAVNARDAMPGGGKLTVRTANFPAAEVADGQFKGMPAADYVMIEVSDTGTGMTQEVMEKIFEPFFSTKEVGKGTGLGLSTVYGIIKQTGGFIYPESVLGEGTTFRIFLPRHVAVEAPPAVEAAKVDATPADLTGNATILLVEDEEAVRAFGARALTSRGYTVHEASTGAEALEVMDEVGGEIDLVVSDVVMPEMDGPTLLKELRKRRPDLKIIFVSGYAEEAFAKNLGENETFVFLPKPFSLKQLAEAVKKTLAN